VESERKLLKLEGCSYMMKIKAMAHAMLHRGVDARR
jgi:hypothetical protein